MKGRAPFPWFGGKQYLVPALLDVMPTHRVYVEPFGGAAALLWSKRPARHEVYNDRDSGLVNFFRVLRDREGAAELARLLELTPCSREEYMTCRETWTQIADDVEMARRWFVVVSQGFSAHMGSKSGWSISRERNTAREYRILVEELPRFTSRIARVQVEHLDAFDCLKAYDGSSTLFYIDPPYLPETRKSGGYRVEMTRDDHSRLLEAITGLRGKVMLSGYRSQLYDTALADWHRKDISTVNWASNRAREKRTECIWLSPNARLAQSELWAS